jgi:NTE family protein
VRFPDKHKIPNALESVLGTFEIMQSAVLAERMKRRKPDLYLSPELRDIRLLDFGKIPEVLLQAQPAADKLKKAFSEKNRSPSIKKLLKT